MGARDIATRAAARYGTVPAGTFLLLRRLPRWRHWRSTRAAPTAAGTAADASAECLTRLSGLLRPRRKVHANPENVEQYRDDAKVGDERSQFDEKPAPLRRAYVAELGGLREQNAAKRPYTIAQPTSTAIS